MLRAWWAVLRRPRRTATVPPVSASRSGRRSVIVLLLVTMVLGGPVTTATASSPGATAAVAAAAVTAATSAGQQSSADGTRVQESFVDGAGGVRLDTTWYLPAAATADSPAPAVLLAHGFGGSKASVATDARELTERGFVVLAWSARGFGSSSGQIALNAADAEVADAQVLLDLLAARPEVIRDGPGDPRVGVSGASYGGALALLLAGVDPRVDAIAPVITWNDLGQALFPNAAAPAGSGPPLDTPAHGTFGADGVFKRGWAGLFFSAGLGPARTGTDPGGSGPDGIGATGSTTDGTAERGAAPAPSGSGADPADGTSPTGPAAPGGTGDGTAPGGAVGGTVGGAGAPSGPLTCGRFTPAVCTAYTEAATTGRLSPATAALLRASSPTTVTARITAPTLLVQGEQDTLFGLDQADANAREIAAGGTPVAVSWYAGGHDGATPATAPSDTADDPVRAAVGAWFDRHLAGRSDGDAAAGFRYVVQSGVRAGANTRTGYTVAAADYPGLAGRDPVRTERLALLGAAQPVHNPAGANPAALTSLPGIGASLGALAGRLSAATAELPGQSARFASAPLTAPLVVTGAPRVAVSISRIPGQPAPAEAVLFAKTYEVTPDGLRTLLGAAVAPIRVPVPADGSPTEVTVTLPGVVAPIESGNRLLVTLSTTDQGYAGPTEPAVWLVGPPGSGAELVVPVVPGADATASTVPLGPAIGIGVVLVVAVGLWLAARLRRRRSRPGDVPAGPTDVATAPATSVPLRVRGLAKTYRGGFAAVRDVSFDVPAGAVLGLLGPNGAGKTTVLRMLMGLIRPTAGTIEVFGTPVTPGSPVLARVGAFVEGPGFLPHLSGADNLRLYWAATGRRAEESQLDAALQIAGLGPSVHRRVGTYSQGMRQRLAIAQAMLGLPELLVLDEPTNGLDPPQIHAMREVLRRYAEGGRTVLVSSHLLAEVEQTCDHVVVMHRGRVVADGTVAEIIAGGGAATFTVDAPQRAATVLAGLPGVAGVAVAADGVHADLNGTPRATAVRALVTAGVDVAAAGPRRRLEEAFLDLVGEGDGDGGDGGSGNDGSAVGGEGGRG